MSVRLTGQNIMITGAARGIGEHVARLAAARGARVALVGLEPERLRGLASALDGGPHYWCEADVTDQTAVESAVAGAVAELGRLDVVIANAGVANLGTVAVSPADAMIRTIDVNLSGVIRTVKATLPHVLATRGYYLLISSAAAFAGLPGMAAYSAAKAGVEQFGNVLRRETAHRGIQVGTAHPSWVDTDMVRDVGDDLPSFRTALRRLPPPFGSTTSVQACAEALLRGVERRQYRVYVPRAVAIAAALRPLLAGKLADRAMAGGRHAAEIEQMESEVRQLGRFFGTHSAGQGTPGHDAARDPARQV